ncbi:MAG TPA: beta-N-acetylhexosaminidase, partial [Chitinophagaceae bacterium]|nr:beta-N-acetylhexosaminidase [Chitinophagaceae bacterium]
MFRTIFLLYLPLLTICSLVQDAAPIFALRKARSEIVNHSPNQMLCVSSDSNIGQNLKSGLNDTYIHPSLIPLPRQLNWKQGSFALSRYKIIVVESDSLHSEVHQLQQWMLSKGIKTKVLKKALKNQPCIEISLREINVPDQQEEAYRLNITSSVIRLSANTSHGIFNSIQTLKQLAANEERVAACTITDWPAFSWRGYMIDVGRNYIEMNLLKQP